MRSALLSRRVFLQGTGATLALTLTSLRVSPVQANSAVANAAISTVSYRDWSDLYRERWTWDRIAKGTHYVNCAYQRGCAWNVYVKDGIVWREEQVADYPQTNAEVPDFNPRGCQKGACYSDRMHDQSRLMHPMKRVGERGAGKWQRISWNQGLTEVADKVIDAMVEDGPGSIIWDMGSAVTNGCHGLGLTRTVSVLDTPMLETNSEIGDHYPGATTTTGKICYTGSFDDLFYSDLILIWGGNPSYTHIPNVHFINEARYHGARVVAITPDYNASCMHADEWVPVEVGSDAALGLALAQVMVEEDLFDREFIVEQTDLPFLVRQDTGLFLRESDLQDGGREDAFYLYDQKTAAVVDVPRSTLALGDLSPSLEGEFVVLLRDGARVKVNPVFTLLEKRLADYSPEAASKITGTPPDQIRKLARTLARAKAASAITQTNFSKYYHGMEMERGMILAFAMAGQLGKKGAGIAAFPYLSISGPDALAVADGRLPPKLGLAALGLQSAPAMAMMAWDGYSTEMMISELARREYKQGRYLATPLWLYKYGGLKELYGSAKRWDPSLPRDFEEYFDEAVAKGWQIAPTTPTRILFEVGGNLLRRVRGYDRMMDGLLPNLDLLVTVDWRMSNTARHSDYVFPAAGWYEKDDITWGSPITPFCHVTTRAVEPLGDSKPDWEFHCLFLKTLQQRAIERGVLEFTDRAGETRRLDRVYDEFTFGQRYTEDNTEEFLDEMLAVTSNLGGVTWPELKEKGYARYTGVGTSPSQINHATDIAPDETITANTWQVQKKQPWPTLTRRMQFYIDHPFFLEMGEELPIHKDNPKIGGDYPLQMTGGHTRWSIHASWRDNETLLKLQRGEPVMFIGEQDAQERSLRDGARARVYNDIGSFEIHCKVAPAIRPGQVVVYHAWEPFQFTKGKSHQSLIPSPMNPIHLAGGYTQLQPTLLMGQPGCPDRGTRVEVETLPASHNELAATPYTRPFGGQPQSKGVRS
ncbi:MAG: molybdopterin-dependent oxidoreductase [Deltaproteobacteria bacterium]|nr:molybdopterin-dependent oxidoreductase [Deltaproteobacteria bacterium]